MRLANVPLRGRVVDEMKGPSSWTICSPGGWGRPCAAPETWRWSRCCSCRWALPPPWRAWPRPAAPSSPAGSPGCSSQTCTANGHERKLMGRNQKKYSNQQLIVFHNKSAVPPRLHVVLWHLLAHYFLVLQPKTWAVLSRYSNEPSVHPLPGRVADKVLVSLINNEFSSLGARLFSKDSVLTKKQMNIGQTAHSPRDQRTCSTWMLILLHICWICLVNRQIW